MKILQVTHFGTTTNYGAVLQAFALQKALRLLGHDPVLLKADFSYQNKIKKWRRSPFSALKAWLNKRASEREERIHPRYFSKFIQENMSSTERTFHTIREVKDTSWDSFDAMVTGSDQVWSNKTPSDLYFLKFGPKNLLRFSYAASVGTKAHTSQTYLEAFQRAVRSFSGISVREYDAMDLCRKANAAAVPVPDPVLLFSMEDYEKFFHLPPEVPEHRICFIYLVSRIKNFPLQEVYHYCAENHLTPVFVSSQNHRSSRRKGDLEIHPSIPDWIRNIRDADMVLTDSFHGTVFSLLFGKKTVIFPKKDFDARFDMLERCFGIGQAIYRGDFQKAAGFHWDHQAIRKKIEILRQEGFDFLKQTLDPGRIPEIITKHDCCGCSLCAEICPQKSISMVPDERGFLFPKIDQNTCIRCNLCRKNCPLNQPEGTLPAQRVFYAVGKNADSVKRSSSGGVFPLLAENILKKGGIVSGAETDRTLNVILDKIESLEDLPHLQRAKYVQASIVPGLFSQLKEALEAGRSVLFSGTPCQVSAFKHFLQGKDYPELLLVELICHGVPSPGIWQSYLAYIEGKTASKAASVSFRDKTGGWHDYALHIEDQAGKVLYHCNHKEDPYCQLFANNMIVRDSCFRCAAKQGRSGADLTLGDFWKLKKIAPELDNRTGASMVIVHTSKGLSCLQKIECETIREMPEEILQENNPLYSRSGKCNDRSEKFYDLWLRNHKRWITDKTFFRKK